MRLIPIDVRYAWRRLAATPLLTFGAMLTLALGIGSAVVMADVLDRLLLRAPAHVLDPDRVTRVFSGGPRAGYGAMAIFDMPTFDALGSLHEDLESSAAYYNESVSFGTGAAARQLQAVTCSPDYFSVLGVQPLIGSFAEFSGRGRANAAVVSYRVWQQAFGGAADVIGKPLRLGSDSYTIVAVAPRRFAGIDFKTADVWLPLAPRARAAYSPGAYFLWIIARLKPGVSRERASERATTAYRATHTDPFNRDRVLVLGDIRPARAPGVAIGTRVEVLVGAMSILVLLITCGNVANLLLVRGLRSDREFVVKTALGATRLRLLREVLLEGTLLAAGAGLVSLVVVVTGGALLRREFLSDVAALASPLDTRLVLVTVVVCIAAAFLLGLTPALRLSRHRALTPGLSSAARPSPVLDLFSGLQVALSLPMIVAASLFVLSHWNARHQDFGMRTDNVAVVSTNLFEVGRRPSENHAVHRQIQARLSRLPQVESTALIENLPMQSRVSSLFEVPGKDLLKGGMAGDILPGIYPVDPSFFSLMRMRLVQGRFFSDEENRKPARSVAVISESMAERIWPGEAAIGKCFYLGGRQNPCTDVIGVVADARLIPSIRPTKQWASAVYLPIEQQTGFTSSRYLMVRTVGDVSTVAQLLRQESQVAAPDLPYVDVHPFDDIFTAMLKPWRLGSIVFVIFGALSMIVAALGLAAVAAYAVTRRTREIGIRSALGATPQQLVRLVLTRSLLVVMGGLAMGMALSWAVGRVLNAQLFDVQAGDPRIQTGAALGLLIVAAFAAWIPARRASSVDPSTALRTE